MANKKSKRKLAKQATLVLSSTAMLISTLLSLPGVLGQQQQQGPSLIESALDGKYVAEPTDKSSENKAENTDSHSAAKKSTRHSASGKQHKETVAGQEAKPVAGQEAIKASSAARQQASNASSAAGQEPSKTISGYPAVLKQRHAVKSAPPNEEKPIVKLVKPGQSDEDKLNAMQQVDTDRSNDHKPVVKLVKPSHPPEANKPVVKLVKPVQPELEKPQSNKLKQTQEDAAGPKPVVQLVKPATPVVPSSVEKSIQANGKVKLVPVPEPTEKDPEPKDLTGEPPIHSEIPYHQPLIPLIDKKIGEQKVDKSFALDSTYRGKPALPVVPTVTFGTPSWVIPDKKKVATGLGPAPISPGTAPQAPVGLNPTNQNPTAGGSSSRPGSTNQLPAAAAGARSATVSAGATQGNALKAQAEQSDLYELNFRIMTDEGLKNTDTIWAYPYPPKPPRQVIPNPLPETEGPLKARLLGTGYAARPDRTRPYPPGGWRWLKVLDNSLRKANMGYAHTMFTMYPWVDKIFPYVRSECHELNLVEEKRSQHYAQVCEDWEKLHVDYESLATSRGLVPVEIKVNPRGIAQAQLPKGNWWITSTRTMPGLKFYWVVPVSCASDKIINIQMNEANATIVAGAW